ncbi:MAG: ATP-binding cassette domain-containing protein [Gemmatimonadaceae bacterium]
MIEAAGLSSRAGRFVLSDATFTIPANAWGIVLGPAGSGKTTLLETIAGVRRATSGSVVLRGVDVTQVPPEGRRVGIVHQHGYLFPHLSVSENIAYGTRDAAAASDIARRLGADALADRAVQSLSGGERQVVALARALAPGPDILLLDEPFAALDQRRRVRVRAELRRLQRERSMTVLHVTHDFVEAGTLGDIAMVMDGGRIAQVADPETLFRKPASGAVADFLGAENVFGGEVTRESSSANDDVAALEFRGHGLTLSGVGDHPGGPGHAVIRGDEVVLSTAVQHGTSARNAIAGTVLEVARDGVLSRVTISAGDASLVAVITSASAGELSLQPGVDVIATIKATAVHLC